MNTHRTIITVGSIFFLRMFGFFAILPIFSLYAQDLSYATPALVGLAFGIYGLTQAMLQIPFGLLSDRFGRKPIITLGLLLLALGSIIAACSDNIYTMLIGRGLQGAGAIGSVLIALVADNTSSQQRSKAMAMIGMFIGLAFSAATISGTLLSSHLGFHGVFWLTAGLALAATLLLYSFIPKSIAQKSIYQQKIPIKQILTHRELAYFNFSIFSQHAIFSALFFALPIILENTLQIPEHLQWRFYLPTVIFSFLIILPIIILSEKKHKEKLVFTCNIAIIILTMLVCSIFHQSPRFIMPALFIYFIAFNYLEAMLPSQVSKTAPTEARGLAMGIYSSAQFLGIFFGGTLAGLLYSSKSVSWILLGCAIIAAVWFGVALKKEMFLIILKKTTGENYG